MALLINSTSPVTGETITNSYVHITDLSTKKNKEGTFDCTIKFSYHITQASRDNDENPFIRNRYIFTYDESSTDNPYVQAYNFMKAQENFTGATDA